MRVTRTVLSVILLGGLQAWGSAYTLEVRNGGCARERAVISRTVTREWAASAPTHTLVETSGGRETPVACGIDASGRAPVLFWQLSGKTEPNAVRRFSWAPKGKAAAAESDLRLTLTLDSLSISNGYFILKHPAKGGGGFPSDLAYAQSGASDPRLFFLDRIVRPQGEGGRLASYCAKDCEDAEARVVFQSPLRVVVEVKTGFGKKAADTPGHPCVCYRYTYAAFSPVVEVSARYTREDDGPWRELHFMHLTRAERHYTAIVSGDVPQVHAMQAKGARSKPVYAPQWAVMTDGTNACGVGFDGANGWDASDEFVYYVRSGCMPWAGRTFAFDGGLYFGPARGAAWYAQWMGRERAPEVRLFKDGKPWVPVDHEPLSGSFELKNRALRVVFDAATNGFDCLGIQNRLAENARFVQAPAEDPGLWSLTFKGPPDASGRQTSAELTNRSPAARRFAERSGQGLCFNWQGLDLPGEPGAVDVRAEVRLEPGDGASLWRINVVNRSARFGLWSSDYPVLQRVAEPGAADVLLPRGNWGGSLMPRHQGAFAGRYPSFGCPLQMLAFNLGDAGLYLAAHDGTARAKELVVTRAQTVTFRGLAENAGVPGAAGAPDYPVVVAAYRGDWWEAARRYRTWALQQPWAAKGPLRQRADYPKRLAELAFWMLLWGESGGVSRSMQEAAQLYDGLPIGVHWYGWHQIPFDNSYPEYFPTRSGMGAAAHKMAQQGQTVMPYLNARLWDRDIPSFAEAYPASCKQASGTNYVETYGSGRSLVPMCPYTRVWQEKVRSVCHRLAAECGVNAIYLDQIGSAAPVACFDAAHGHPVGGGSHWVDGYHAMLNAIRTDAAGQGVALTTEDSAESYLDVIDGCLAWNPRHQEDVPLLPAVYSGYTVYFTSPQASQDSLDAFCAAQARDFLWGCQLGWNDPWILSAEHREKQRFQLTLCKSRLAAKDFMVYGQLVDQVRPLKDVPENTHLWNRRQPHSVHLPAVMGTVWKDARGRLAVVVVNASGAPQTFDFNVAPERWLGRRGPWRVTPLAQEDGASAKADAGGGAVFGDLPPRSVRILVFTPEP